MLDRRNILKTGAASAALALLTTPALTMAARAAAAAGGDAAANPAEAAASKKLHALFDSFVQEGLDHSPEGVTSLGLDHGKRAYQKSELSQSSLAEIARNKAMTLDEYKRLKAFDTKPLGEEDQISYDVVMFGLEHGVQADKAFNYGGGGAGSPYVVSQLTGSYQQTPDFLDSQHSIETKADAEAFLARLDAFARQMDQEDEVVKHDAGLGVVPPDFILARALEQMTKLRSVAPEKATVVESLVKRTKAKNIEGKWGEQATAIVKEKILIRRSIARSR